jgi:hypothetical protein
MTNLYQITVCKSKGDDAQKFQKSFQNAFHDIHALTRLICESKKRAVQAFIESDVDDDPPWLSFDDEQVIIIAEMQELNIHRDDAKTEKDIFYDFGKRFPADDYFILAVMAIFMHHLPQSVIGEEVDYDPDGMLGSAIRLAALVNPAISDPYPDLRSSTSRRSEDINEVIEALSSKSPAIKPVEMSSHSKTITRHRESSGIAAKKSRKIADPDPQKDSNDTHQPRK